VLGVNITLKDGLLLFSHFFVPGFSDVDEDLRAGLMTAVLNAVKESNSNSDVKTEIATIDQGKYFVHIVEGRYTYGLFFSYENDLKEEVFANSTLTDFETQFQNLLSSEVNEFDDTDFQDFHQYLETKYSNLISIDVVGLSKVIEIMEDSLFSDYIILEKPHLHQVFTTISIPELYPHANTVALMCKSILEASYKIQNPITQLTFNLGSSYWIIVEQFGKYIVICITMSHLHDKTMNEMNRLKSKFISLD